MLIDCDRLWLAEFLRNLPNEVKQQQQQHNCYVDLRNNNLQFNCFRRYAFIHLNIMADIYERFLYENMWTETIIRSLSIVGDEEEQRLTAVQLCFVGVLV